LVEYRETRRAAVSCAATLRGTTISMRRLLVATSLLFALSPAIADAAQPDAGPAVPHAVEQYKWFHAHPELSNEETKTAAHLAEQLRALGLEVHEGIGGHGLVGILRNGKGPVVLYRADMDGLPVAEKTGVPWHSENSGVMHACGHDVHMASAVGALDVLSRNKGSWKGTVLFVGQPAEELGTGARQMLADKKFKKILARVGKPKAAVALHDAADLPAGEVSLIEGFHHANVDSVDIVVHGKGGHGARPHETIDPVVIGAEIVMALQTIVSRRIRPDEKAVVTVGKFASGTKHNIIPSDATLLLTVRSYADETRKTLLAEIQRVARQIAKAHRAPRAPEVRFDEGLPAAYNDPEMTRRIRKRFVEVLGDKNVKVHNPSLGGEDFGVIPRELGIPGVMWKLGAVDPKRFAKTEIEDLPGLHSDGFAADPERTMRAGIETVVAAILEVLEG
jgi:hippurate hydrolase